MARRRSPRRNPRIAGAQVVFTRTMVPRRRQLSCTRFPQGTGARPFTSQITG